MNLSNKLALAVSLSLATGAAGVAAQDTASGSMALEEIVVTARKRVETVQDAPLAIQAFTSAQLEERGVQNLADLAKFTPGLTFNAGTSRASSDFSIRGMNQISPVGDNRRDLVTVFVDGVPYVGNPSGLGAEDLERVEVIKGPQSALFGRATFGGAISMITSTPGDQFKAKVTGTLANYSDRRLSASVEGPIVEGILAGRAVWEGSTFGGFYPNALGGGRLGTSDKHYYSGTLSFTPTEDIKVKLRYGQRHDEDGPSASTLIARYFDHNCGPFPGYQTRSLLGLPAGFTLDQARKAYCGELKTPSSIGINTSLPAASFGLTKFNNHHLELDHRLLSGSAEWTFLGGYSLTAVASNQNQEVALLADFERTPDDRYQAFSDNIQTQKSYELRLASPAKQRLTWMVGVAKLDATFTTIGGFVNGALFGATAGGPAPAALVPARSASKTDSVFASLGFDITEALNLSLEARRQKDKISSGVGLPTQFGVETTATLPRALLLYKLSPETNIYANYAKGNQPTQGYATYFQLTPAQQVVASANGVNPTAPEAKVTNYEMGIKHRAEDGRWYLNTSVYYLEWVGRQGVRGIQVDLNGDGVITVLPAPQGEVFNAVPFSAGDSNTKGIELDGAYKITPSITVGGSLAYADTTITKALNESIPLRLFGRTDSKGFKFPLVPELSGAAFAQYEVSLANERSWFVRADTTYIGKRYDSIVNLAWVPVQIRTNLKVGLRAKSWDVTAFVDNLFDDKTLEWARYQSDSAADPFLFQLASSEALPANKRQFGVTASYRF